MTQHLQCSGRQTQPLEWHPEPDSPSRSLGSGQSTPAPGNFQSELNPATAVLAFWLIPAGFSLMPPFSLCQAAPQSWLGQYQSLTSGITSGSASWRGAGAGGGAPQLVLHGNLHTLPRVPCTPQSCLCQPVLPHALSRCSRMVPAWLSWWLLLHPQKAHWENKTAFRGSKFGVGGRAGPVSWAWCPLWNCLCQGAAAQ